MKAKKIIPGTVFISIILLLIPNISAVEYRTVLTTNKSILMEHFNANDFQKFTQQLKKIDNPQIQKSLESFTYENVKQILTNEHYVDIALILVIITLFLFRIATVLTQGPSENILLNTIRFIIGISIYFIYIVNEYQTGVMSIPRYSAYQAYFIVLFSGLFLLIINQIPDTHVLVKMILSVLAGFFTSFIAKYLGNLLYVAMGRPT